MCPGCVRHNAKNSMACGVCGAVPQCPICQGRCKCKRCHGVGDFGTWGCKECGKVRPGCEKCRGPCKCAVCHGHPRLGQACSTCGRRGSCWGGDTLVLQPQGATKKVRDCRVGDAVRTLQGSKRIARVWKLDKKLVNDVEVCCIDGVWITSHHPIISGSQWVYPADLEPSALWCDRLHLMPDMYNFELEGHDDTILLWGGRGLVISCTIGKYLGPRFGFGICTRRSTRCAKACEQCNAVHMDGLRFDALPSQLRWKRFPPCPQVEWPEEGVEFQLAANAIAEFVQPARAAASLCQARETQGPKAQMACTFQNMFEVDKWLSCHAMEAY